MKCLVCKKEYHIRPSVFKEGYGRYCSLKCFGFSTRGRDGYWSKGKPTWIKGKHWSKESRIKNSNKHLGEKSFLYKGGVSTKEHIIRQRLEIRLWKEDVKKRDNFTCQWCGAKDKLVAHHIKGFTKYPELRFVLDNGLTLCEECHKKTDNYLVRVSRQN